MTVTSVDGMRITFAGRVARDTVTIQQWGDAGGDP